MNTNTLRPEYGEIAECFLLAWDAGDYDRIPASIFILELVEKCQEEADRQASDAAITEMFRTLWRSGIMLQWMAHAAKHSKDDSFDGLVDSMRAMIVAMPATTLQGD